jgi:hypothetical protein
MKSSTSPKKRRLRATTRSTLKRLLVLIALISSLAMLAACGQNAVSQAPPSPTPAATPTLPIAVTDAGFTVSLVKVEPKTNSIAVTFRVEAVPGNQTANMDLYGGLEPFNYALTGASWVNDQSGALKMIGDRSVAPPRLVAIEDTFDLSLTQDASQPVEITINALPFRGSNPSVRDGDVKGHWDFRFTPGSIQPLPSTHLSVEQNTKADGAMFLLDSIDQSAKQTVVTFHVMADSGGRLGAISIVAILPDGSIVSPQRVEDGQEEAKIATFDALPAGEKLTFALQPTLVEVKQPVDLTIPVDGQTVAAGQAGQPIPLSLTQVVGGENLGITSVTPGPDSFQIRIENKQPDHSGRVLLFMPGPTDVTLKDNLGNTYPIMGGTSNFGKSDLLTMWADASTLTFKGTLAPGVTELTLHTDSYARQLRGPWKISVQLPVPDNG